MNRTSVKRAVAGLATLAISGVSLVAMAPPASAVVAGTISSASAPTVLNTTNQSAGDLVIDVVAAAVNGDTIDVRVAPTTGDCATAEEAANGIQFVSAVDDNPNVTLSLVDDCPGAANFNNVLRLTFTGPVADTANITISQIKYDISPTVPTFPQPTVRVKLGAGPFVAGNATIGKVNRIEGATRYHTAGEIAKAHNACPDSVVVVSGTNFPDALAASFLGKPILLVEPNAVPQATKDALTALGAKNVTVVGGTTAVSSGVFLTLQGLDEGACGDPASGKLNVNRIAGATRYSTALAVATSAAAGTMDEGLGGACNAVKTALVVSGENFPDALAAGTLASNGVNTGVCGNGDGIPLVLTTPGALSPEAAEAINTMGATQVIIVGGTQAVSSATANAIDALAGVTNVERIAGATRTETATDFAEMLGTPNGGNYGNRRVFVASGANFPDALVAGPLGGLRFAPIILSSSAGALGADAANFIEDTTTVNEATLLGGTVALNGAVQNQTGAAFLARN